MQTTYQPHIIEPHWYQTWETKGYFQPQGQLPTFCIMIPPPNVTGSLHMGHGFQQTLMDILVRYHRMQGQQTLWQVGTDHAGIATQMMVERNLAKQGILKQDIGRDAFIEQVWQWKNQSGSTITQQMRRLGISVDWQRERFTMDSHFSSAVQETFIKLYQEGLIYRGQRLVNWDPQFKTAISDLEVIATEENGFLWFIRYPLVDSNEFITVATTRPETLLGDVAVAVHPNDSRYQSWIGKKIKLPLTDREVPIIADENVDPEFGTGCVKITPAHDFNDYAMGQRHNLPLINIFTEEAKLNQNAPVAYQGLDRFIARKKIIADVEQLGLLEKVEPHMLKIPRAERGHTIVEPYLTWQWFVNAKVLAEAAINVVKEQKIRFVPENWTKTYDQWLENIQDWCISRQLWWGHRIPAWYDETGQVYVGRTEEEIRQNYPLASGCLLKQDEDVLDTWFSSALWPFATLGWPNQTPELKTFYPTSVLVTGFDIIFFWVARMVMMGMKLVGQVPFREVYIHGLIRDAEGQKMSKTKGNVLDPIDLIDGIDLEALVQKRTQGLLQPDLASKIEKNTRKEFPKGIQPSGTDALRFTFCALATTGRDIRFDTGRLEGYRNFCNKIWNAARFIFMNLENQVLVSEVESVIHPINLFIQHQLNLTIQQAHDYISQYRFDLLAQTLYDFTWNEFCDWYLEFAKVILQSKEFNDSFKDETRFILVKTFDSLLRLLHPIMPFITEELWQQLKPYSKQTKDTIQWASYPTSGIKQLDSVKIAEVDYIKSFIIAVRTLRSENKISPAKKVAVTIMSAKAEDKEKLTRFMPFISALAKIERMDLEPASSPRNSVTTLLGEIEISISLDGLVDLASEKERLLKEYEKALIEYDKIQQRLNNPSFVENAPKIVMEKDKQRAEELKLSLEKLKVKIS